MTKDSITDNGGSGSGNPLGQQTQYIYQYSPDLLFAIPRQPARDELGLTTPLPFSGTDTWNAYEISWLDSSGSPHVAVGEIRVDAASVNIVESKSLKLYLNSLNDSTFESADHLRKVIEDDLCERTDGPVNVQLKQACEATVPASFQGMSLDHLAPGAPENNVNPGLLRNLAEPAHQPESVSETFHTHLFRSLCPITGQPDWAAVVISYRGPAINPTSLLRYLNSYRRHGAYHEQCVEQIYMDIKSQCKTQALSVYARFLRRGGLDINPFRSDFETTPENRSSWRQ